MTTTRGTVTRLDFVANPADPDAYTNEHLNKVAALALDARAAGHGWVTATANIANWRTDNPDAPTRWADLRTLVLKTTETTRFRLELPTPRPGATGTLWRNQTRHDLLALPDGLNPASAYHVLQLYPHIHPRWLATQPEHTLTLLHAIASCRPPGPDGADDADGEPVFWVGYLTLDQLLETCGPLLHAPPQLQETVAHTVNEVLQATDYDDPPPLEDVLHLAHAFG